MEWALIWFGLDYSGGKGVGLSGRGKVHMVSMTWVLDLIGWMIVIFGLGDSSKDNKYALTDFTFVGEQQVPIW